MTSLRFCVIFWKLLLNRLIYSINTIVYYPNPGNHFYLILKGMKLIIN